MNRRTAMMTLTSVSALAGTTGMALAQAAGAMGEAEMTHAKNTAMVGAVALQTSDIALSKARTAKVKQFAQFEHDEQTTVAEILSSMGLTPPGPDPKMAPTIAKLKEQAAGSAFDKAYVTAQMEGHEALLKIQEDYLKVGKKTEHVAVAKLVRGMVKEHLVHLKELQKAG